MVMIPLYKAPPMVLGSFSHLSLPALRSYLTSPRPPEVMQALNEVAGPQVVQATLRHIEQAQAQMISIPWYLLDDTPGHGNPQVQLTVAGDGFSKGRKESSVKHDTLEAAGKRRRKGRGGRRRTTATQGKVPQWVPKSLRAKVNRGRYADILPADVVKFKAAVGERYQEGHSLQDSIQFLDLLVGKTELTSEVWHSVAVHLMRTLMIPVLGTRAEDLQTPIPTEPQQLLHELNSSLRDMDYQRAYVITNKLIPHSSKTYEDLVMHPHPLVRFTAVVNSVDGLIAKGLRESVELMWLPLSQHYQEGARATSPAETIFLGLILYRFAEPGLEEPLAILQRWSQGTDRLHRMLAENSFATHAQAQSAHQAKVADLRIVHRLKSDGNFDLLSAELQTLIEQQRFEAFSLAHVDEIATLLRKQALFGQSAISLASLLLHIAHTTEDAAIYGAAHRYIDEVSETEGQSLQALEDDARRHPDRPQYQTEHLWQKLQESLASNHLEEVSTAVALLLAKGDAEIGHALATHENRTISIITLTHTIRRAIPEHVELAWSMAKSEIVEQLRSGDDTAVHFCTVLLFCFAMRENEEALEMLTALAGEKV